MPTDDELDQHERRALRTLMQPSRRPADCTTARLATAMATSHSEAHRALRSLETRDPQLAHPVVDIGLGTQVWVATYDAADALDPEGDRD